MFSMMFLKYPHDTGNSSGFTAFTKIFSVNFAELPRIESLRGPGRISIVPAVDLLWFDLEENKLSLEAYVVLIISFC